MDKKFLLYANHGIYQLNFFHNKSYLVGNLDDIELTEGELWEVDPEILEGIDRISQTLEKSNPESIDDYRALGRKLEEGRKNLEDQRESTQPYDSNRSIYLGPLEQKTEALQEVDSKEEGERLKAEIEKQNKQN